MKKTLLIATTACLVAGAAFASTPKNNSMARQIAEYVRNVNKGKVTANPLIASTRAAESLPDNIYGEGSSVVWCPGLVTNYWWDNQSWIVSDQVKYTYNEKGQILTRGSENFQVEYQYDADGRLYLETTKYFNGMEWVIENISEYSYDSVVKDLVIKTLSKYEWSSSEYGMEITRNADGNITEVKDYSMWDAEKYYNGVMDIKYGADGKASEIVESYYENGRLIPETTYSNIEWQNTDGQIYEMEIDDYNADSYFGSNRIKSAIVVDDEWPSAATLKVLYNADNIGLHAVLDMAGDVIYDFIYDPVDEYGSYDVSLVEVDWDDEDGKYYKDYTRTGTKTYRVDKFGLVLEEISKGVEVEERETESYYDAEKGTVTYDSVTGCPSEYIEEEFDDDSNRYVVKSRTVFGDYSTSAVEDIELEEDAPAVYFNLQGERVSNPDSGIFIRRQGNTSTKVFVK